MLNLLEDHGMSLALAFPSVAVKLERLVSILEVGLKLARQPGKSLKPTPSCEASTPRAQAGTPKELLSEAGTSLG